jgi:hypothetical protein
METLTTQRYEKEALLMQEFESKAQIRVANGAWYKYETAFIIAFLSTKKTHS